MRLESTIGDSFRGSMGRTLITAILRVVTIAVVAGGVSIFLMSHLSADVGESLECTATAVVRNSANEDVGNVVIADGPNGVIVRARLRGLSAGVHGFHIHEKGVCAPDFSASGGHFNPTDVEHGYRNTAGFHYGDLPNLHVPESGAVAVEFFAPWLNVCEGERRLLDDDGAAVVVHQGTDDHSSNPSGGAGKRFGCGVLQPTQEVASRF